MHMVNDNSLVQYINTGNVLQDMRSIIEASRANAYQAVNLELVRRN